MLSFFGLILLLSLSFSLSFSLKMAAAPANFYDIIEKSAKGTDVNFSNFKGKVVYGVNVASKCGYTASGYQLLSKIAKLKADGKPVEVLVYNNSLLLLLLL